MARLYIKWLNDLKDRHEDLGRIPAYSPRQANGSKKWDVPPRSISITLITWHMYQYYDDRNILEEHYTAMKLWFNGIEKREGIEVRPHIVKGGASD